MNDKKSSTPNVDSAERRRLEDELAIFNILKKNPEAKSPSGTEMPNNSTTNHTAVTPSMGYAQDEEQVLGSKGVPPKVIRSSSLMQGGILTPPEEDIREDDISTLGNQSESRRFKLLSQGVMDVLGQSLMLLRGESPGSSNDDSENQSIPDPPSTNAIIFEGSEAEDDNSEFSVNPIPEVITSPRASEAGMDSLQRTYFLNDRPRDMTLARRMALFLMRYKWYNPQQLDLIQEPKSNHLLMKSNHSSEQDQDGLFQSNDENKSEAEDTDEEGIPEIDRPSLKKGWAYFEHVTLPRHVVKPKEKKGKQGLYAWRKEKMSRKLDRAEPGEKYKPTKLYSPLFTPLSQMGDFGLGVGLYFSTLRALVILTFIAGIINIPNIIYFSSERYSDSQETIKRDKPLLAGSAICTKQSWVPCPDCTIEDFSAESYRFATSNITVDGVSIVLPFALKNDCEVPGLEQGMVNWATTIFLLVGIWFMNFEQKRMSVKFDEDEQTAQDYSIIVSNPPPDATDPDEWKEFFSIIEDAHVTCVTIALDNDLLVRSLLERRERLQQIKMMLPPGTPLDELNLARIAAEIEFTRKPLAKLIAMIFHPFGLLLDVPALQAKLVVLTAKIRGLAQRSYPVTNVFVTFETEAAQRLALSRLSLGKFPIWRNDAKSLPSEDYLFRGSKVLNVSEPEEPSTVRWQDLNAKLKDQLKQVSITTFVTLGAIALVAFIVFLCSNQAAAFAAIAISVFNAVFPVFGKAMTNLETHPSETGKQTSLYFKISAFRWVNTAIVITIIKPFTSTLMEGGEYLLYTVYAIFFAEIVTTNALQFIDPFGHIQRHIFAPRALNQEKMNMQFRGTIYELAERYTNMTKILFLTFFYCAIYPAAFFMCSFALLVNYYFDSFSIMRTWTPAPRLGDSISRLSRKYFFSAAVLALAIVSSYWWTGFPYDNLCDNDEKVGSEYIGKHYILPHNDDDNNAASILGFMNDQVSMKQIEVDANDTLFRFCNQDMLRLQRTMHFPAWPIFQPKGDEWMTEDQELLGWIYGSTSLVVLFLVIFRFVWDIIHASKRLFKGIYKPIGQDMGINFSQVTSACTYIPQCTSAEFSYPLIVCGTDGIDEDLFDWTDPDRPYDYYNLTKDAEEILMGNDVTKDASTNVFSRVKYWPPDWPDVKEGFPVVSKTMSETVDLQHNIETSPSKKES